MHGRNAAVTLDSRIPLHWTCFSCTLSDLPFFNIRDISKINASLIENDTEQYIDSHLKSFHDNKHLMKLMHLNTQSMMSSFDEFCISLKTYPFDLVASSETWLTDNQYLLDYVNIPGYIFEYHNRKGKRGGGVGIYIKEDIKYKRRKDIENLKPNLEHLWVEIMGKNRFSNILVCVLYQPNFEPSLKELWLDDLDGLLSQVNMSLGGPIFVTGDMNIDLLN